jgi:type I restriction enzyme S subunit
MGNTPNIRFIGFTDDWEQRKFSDVVEIGSGMDYKHLGEGDIPVYGTGGYMLSVDSALSEEKDAIGIGRKGTIDKPYILRAPFWTVDTLFYCIPKENHDLDFINCLFQTVDWKKKDESTGVPSLSKVIINNVEAVVPSFDEQKKIGEYFNNLDHLITLHQRKCDEMKKMKKFMLQKMFPKNGQKNPEIRFDGFTDDWEQRKLGDYLQVSSEKNRDNRFTKDDVLSVSGEYGIVNQIEFQGRSFAGASVSNYGVVETGDVVYTKSPLKSNPYGIIKTNKGIPGIVSTLYAVYRPKEITDSKFVQIYFELDSRMNSYMHPLVNKGAKNDMKVSAENALKGMVSFPQKDEQKRISSYFDTLDHLITLHQRKVENLKNLKKYMLQNMFV